jgi:hypothetical protein
LQPAAIQARADGLTIPPCDPPKGPQPAVDPFCSYLQWRPLANSAPFCKRMDLSRLLIHSALTGTSFTHFTVSLTDMLAGSFVLGRVSRFGRSVHMVVRDVYSIDKSVPHPAVISSNRLTVSEWESGWNGRSGHDEGHGAVFSMHNSQIIYSPLSCDVSLCK